MHEVQLVKNYRSCPHCMTYCFLSRVGPCLTSADRLFRGCKGLQGLQRASGATKGPSTFRDTSIMIYKVCQTAKTFGPLASQPIQRTAL